MARPRVQIDWDQVGELLKCGCDTTSIATSLGISADTLYTRSKTDRKQDFTAFSQQKKAEGSDLLRRKQFELAMNGNVPMLIWLGKNRLGQAEKQEIKTQEVSVSNSQKDDHLFSIVRHAQRVYEVRKLEPLGMTFDSENPEHRLELRKEVAAIIEFQGRMYPDQSSTWDGWEERFDKQYQ